MSNPINPNLQPKYPQPLTGTGQTPLQNIDSQKIKDKVNDNPVSKMTEETNPALYAGVFIPTAAAAYVGMNKFGDACRGEYGSTLLGRLDNFDTKMKTSKLIDNPVVNGIKKGSKATVDFLDKWIIQKNQILKAFFHTPAMPENKMALTQMNGISADIATSAVQMFESYTKNGTEIEKVRKLLPEMAAEADDAVVKHYKDIVENAYKYDKDIEKICNAMGTEAATKIEHGGKIPWSKYFNKGKLFQKGTPVYLTDLFPNTKWIQSTFARTVHFDEYANKIRASRKGLSRVLLQVIEGLTNAGSGAAGGGAIIAAVMGAWFVTDAITRTIKAPKGDGEKRKTFMENMLYNIGFYITIPIATKAMHAFGGLRYIGMTKEQVAEYRAKIKDLNAKVDARELTKEQYKDAIKELKILKKGKTRMVKGDKTITNVGKFFTNLVHKPTKWFFDKVYMAGNEFAKPFVAKDASKFAETMKKIQFKAKDFSAYPVRMLLFMMIFAPFFAKFFAKGSHLLFGKPKVSVLDEGKEPTPAQGQALPAQQAIVQPNQVKPQSVVQPTAQPTAQNINRAAVTTSPDNNLIKSYKAPEQKPVAEKTAPAAPKHEHGRTYSYIPSSESKIAPAETVETTKDPEVLKLLGKSESAEKNANKYLGGE